MLTKIKVADMFFNKKPEQAVTTQRPESLEWDQGNRRSQSFRIIAASWFFKAQPGLQYQRGGKLEFTFEGQALLGTTPNVPVYGEIEVRDDVETPRFLTDRWQRMPDSVEGYASLSTAKDPSLPPQLYITLYCTTEALNWVSRVFVAGFSASGGKTALDIDISHPDDMGSDFWHERWQHETLQVLKWDVRSTAER